METSNPEQQQQQQSSSMVLMGEEAQPASTAHLAAGSEVDVAQEATSLPPYSPKADIAAAADEMFANIEDYLQAEISISLDDYKLLETMNSMSSEKYQGLNVTLGEVVNNVANMNKTYEELLSKLALVDRLDKKVTGLEKMAYALDAYSKRLEKQYKLLEKRVHPPSARTSTSSTSSTNTTTPNTS